MKIRTLKIWGPGEWPPDSDFPSRPRGFIACESMGNFLKCIDIAWIVVVFTAKVLLRGQITGGAFSEKLAENSQNGLLTRHTAPRELSKGNMRFLIVDDSDTPLQFLKRVLTGMGHEVAGTARNGLEAVEAYHALCPDVVIMDVIMPRQNGLEACRRIFQADPGARVVMSSSLNSCRTALEAERLGACYWLSKPYSEARLRTVIARLEGTPRPGSNPATPQNVPQPIQRPTR